MCKFPADYFSQNGIFFHVLFLLPVYPYLCFMVTEQFVRDEFVSEILRRDVNIIYDTQQEVVDRFFKVRTGTLRASVSRHDIDLRTSSGRTAVYLRVLPYLRFLDMQYRLQYSGSSKRAKHMRAKFAVYNRIVWGVLYKETFPDIQAGFTNEVRAAWRKKMEEALANHILPNEIET